MPSKPVRNLCIFLIALSISVAQAQQIRHGLYRGMPVTYTVKNGKAIFQGDIVPKKFPPSIRSGRCLRSASTTRNTCG